jgi:hypothetical protein
MLEEHVCKVLLLQLPEQWLQLLPPPLAHQLCQLMVPLAMQTTPPRPPQPRLQQHCLPLLLLLLLMLVLLLLMLVLLLLLSMLPALLCQVCSMQLLLHEACQ